MEEFLTANGPLRNTNTGVIRAPNNRLGSQETVAVETLPVGEKAALADSIGMTVRSSSQPDGTEPASPAGSGWRERFPLVPWLAVAAVVLVSAYITVLRVLVARRSEEWWMLVMLLLPWASAISLIRFFRGEPPPLRLMWSAIVVTVVTLTLHVTGGF